MRVGSGRGFFPIRRLSPLRVAQETRQSARWISAGLGSFVIEFLKVFGALVRTSRVRLAMIS